jgi:hypothetical protein
LLPSEFGQQLLQRSASFPAGPKGLICYGTSAAPKLVGDKEGPQSGVIAGERGVNVLDVVMLIVTRVEYVTQLFQ